MRLKILLPSSFLAVLLLFIPVLSIEAQTSAPDYTNLIQQADQALSAKDYPASLLFYEKANRLKPEQKYAASKISEINAILDATSSTRSELFENVIIKAENFYKAKNYSSAKNEYQKALSIDPSAQFPKDRLSQISAVFTDPSDLNYFSDAVADGDRASASGNYEKAILYYETALTVKPDAKAVKDKIANAKKMLLQLKTNAEQAALIIATADKLLLAEKRTEALAEYQKAMVLTPDNSYAKQKIAEITKYLAEKDAQQAMYDKSIELADQFYINRDFVNARLKYQEALKAKPGARYPKEMLDKTQSGESQLLSDQEKYDAALASAENLLKSSDYEAALIGFKSALALKPSENYPKTKITELEKLISDRTSRKEAYDIAIKNGNQAFDEKKYDPALAHYRNAITLLPDEKYPAQKVEEITTLVNQRKALDENYKSAIAEADKQFNLNEFEKSIALYTQASVSKPDETYPQQKITEAQGKLSASKSSKEIYANAIATGNRFLAEFKYKEALEAYELSRSVFPFEGYPISKISEINFLLTKYNKEIEKGDKAFLAGNFDLAIESYQDASVIKPSEQYPQDKITEAKTAIAAKQKNAEKYTTALNTGDQLFAGKEYERAIVAYQEAVDININEKYPAEQIAKINRLLSDLHSADENYSKTIADADASFNNKKYAEAITSYTNALKLKPAETYPKLQIEKINALVAEQKKVDADYLSAITTADKFLAAKNYDEAIADYRKAIELKPSEKYPADKIAEAEKLIADQKTLEESYSKAIADGDKYFFDKDYLKSLASFKNAGSFKPDEAYPKQKITELQAILDKDKAEGVRYQEAVTQGDKHFAESRFAEALDAYQQAAGIKPQEKYPVDQIAKINQILVERKKLDEDYQKLLLDADIQLKASKYSEARSLFQAASELKPTEKLPKEKTAEIDSILADIKNKEQSYAKAVSDGDAFFAASKLTEAIESYSRATVLKPTETYPGKQIEKINILIEQQKQQEEKYQASVSKADQLFDEKKYSEAIPEYRNSLVLKPSAKHPADRILEAEKLIADLLALDLAYDKAVTEGNRKFTDKEFENALTAFRNASKLKPAEALPLQKISEIQNILDKLNAEKASYEEAIALADKFFAGKKFREALEPYQRATTIKPIEKYPQDQIKKINLLLDDQKKLDDTYTKALADADNELKLGKYTEAAALYNEALKLKPTEQLPKDQLAKIDDILAELKLKDANYAKAIQDADELYNVKNLLGALKKYQEASEIKPAEKLPLDRIAAINAELKEIDTKYAKAIALADSRLAAKDLMESLNAYQNALEIKPGEDYPKAKIAEINTALLTQKEEMEKMFTSYIAEGDQLFGVKDYPGAKSAYTKASGIKADESYPKQKIAEINKIVEEIELARKAEYTKALGEADKLYNTKIFDQAIDAYESAAKINTGDNYPQLQIAKIRKYMVDHAIQDLFSQTLLVSEGTEKKFTFAPIEPRLRKNNYILLKARSTGKTAPKVYLNYGRDNQKNGGIVLRSLDKKEISDFLIRISVQDKWYREDNNWISLFIETGEIEISKVQIAAGDE